MESSPDINFVTKKLDESATIGLRTLLMGVKEIPPQYWDQFKIDYNEANCDLKNREARKAKCQNDFEEGFKLLGATAIEDKLQDKVADTIEFVRNAGIKLWV